MATTWRPPDDVARRLRVQCALDDRSANAIITEAVTEWLDRNQSPQTAELLAANEPSKDTPS